MGTNYYVETDCCPHCGRGDEDIHVGKSSVGWKFLFMRHDHLGLTTKKEWDDFLRKNDGRIRDEYGSAISAAELIGLIEKKQEQKLTGQNCFSICGCSQYCRTWNANPSEAMDADGYRISDGHEFS